MLRRLSRLLFTIVSLAAFCGCKDSAEKKAEDQAAANARVCAKIDTLTGGSSPRQRDECLAQLGSIGPNVRACFDPCIDRAKDKIDYEVCKDECTSREGFAAGMCTMGYLFDQTQRATCSAALGPLEKSDKPKLVCIDRCRHEAPPTGIVECSKRCGGPALPVAHDPTAPPAVPPPSFGPP